MYKLAFILLLSVCIGNLLSSYASSLVKRDIVSATSYVKIIWCTTNIQHCQNTCDNRAAAVTVNYCDNSTLHWDCECQGVTLNATTYAQFPVAQQDCTDQQMDCLIACTTTTKYCIGNCSLTDSVCQTACSNATSGCSVGCTGQYSCGTDNSIAPRTLVPPNSTVSGSNPQANGTNSTSSSSVVSVNSYAFFVTFILGVVVPASMVLSSLFVF